MISTDFVRRLETAILAVCPAHGVSIGNRLDKSTWRPDAKPEATPQQLAEAQAVIDAFDMSDAAQHAWEADQQPERKGIRAAAAQAVSDNSTFLALATPTNAQVLTQVKALTQQNNRIIKRLIQID